MEPINDRNSKEIFGFILQPVGKDDFGSKIYYGYKIKKTHHFKEHPTLNRIKVGDTVVIESVKRFDEDSKNNEVKKAKSEQKSKLFLKRLKCITKMCNANEEFANFLGMNRTETTIYSFYQFNKQTCLKVLNKKDKDYEPKKKDQEKAVEILLELTTIYQKLKDKSFIHRMIYPEFIFYEGDKLKLNLFGICVPEKYFEKTTMVNSKNKPPECITNTSEPGKKKKIYTYKFDIWNMGRLLFYLIYGKNYFNDQDSNERKREINSFNIDNLTELTNEVKVVLKGCLDRNEDTRMDLAQLQAHLKIAKGFLKTSDNCDLYIRQADEFQSGIDSKQKTFVSDNNESKAQTSLITYENKTKLDKDIKIIEKAFESLLNQLETSYALSFSFDGDIKKQIARALLYQGKALNNLYEQCFTYYPERIIRVSGKDSNIKKSFISYLSEVKLKIDDQVNLINEIVKGLGINENPTEKDLNFFIKRLNDLLSDIFIMGEEKFNDTPSFIDNVNMFIEELRRPCFNYSSGRFEID